MSNKKQTQMTFASLDKEQGLPDLPPAIDEEFPLPAWYRSVREVALDDLEVEDLARACRQQIHLDRIVPIVVERLRVNPLAGGMYDGELLSSLVEIASEFWGSHKDEAMTLKSVIARLLSDGKMADEIREDAQNLLKKLGS